MENFKLSMIEWSKVLPDKKISVGNPIADSIVEHIEARRLLDLI